MSVIPSRLGPQGRSLLYRREAYSAEGVKPHGDS